jgi:hypothetical protein
MAKDLFENMDNAGGPQDLFALHGVDVPETRDKKATDWYKNRLPNVTLPTSKENVDKLIAKNKDELYGLGETLYGLAKGTVAGIQAPVAAAIKRATGSVDDWEKEANRLMNEGGYQPQTEAGDRNLSAIGEFMNQVGIPMAGIGHSIPTYRVPFSRAPKKLATPTKDFDSILNKAPEIPTEESVAAWKARAEDMQRNDQTVARLEAAIAKQNPKQPTIALPDQRGGAAPIIVSPDGTAIRPQDVPWRDRVVEQQRVANEEVKGRNNAEQEALLEQAIQENAQRAIAEREAAQAFEVNRRASLDRNAADRARQEQAPVPGLAEARLREIEDSIARTQELNTRGQQMNIVEDFGNNDPMARMPNMRVDENGMPIRADLSIEAQQMQNPLQRNLWGDELPIRTGDNGIPLTQALDKMPAGPARDAAITSLSVGPKPPARMPASGRRGELDSGLPENPTSGSGNPSLSPMGRIERGAIDIKAVTEGLAKLKEKAISSLDYVKLFKGAFDENQLTRAIEDSFDPKSRSTLSLMSPDEFHKMAYNRPEGHEFQAYTQDKHQSIRDGLASDNGLRAIPYLLVDTDKNGKLYVTGHEGRHRMDMFKEIGIDKVPIVIKHATSRWGEDKVPSTVRPQPKIDFSAYISEDTPRPIRVTPKPLNSGFGKGQKGAWLFSNKPKTSELQPQPTNKPDTLSTPRTPETIARKTDLAAKAKLVNLENTPYDRVTTLEEAVSTIDPKNDMWKAGATNLRSGAEAAVRTNVKNKQVNFVRTILQEARNQAETMSKRYLTDNKTGIIRMVKDLSEQERVDMAHALMALDRNQRPLTPEVMESFGFTEKQKAAALRIREALDERYASANKALGEQGFSAFYNREGYMPSMFSGAYVSFVGMLDKDGKFITKGIAQADTKFGHDAAIAKYKEMGPEYSVVLPGQRRGLNTRVGHNKTYNGFTDLVARIAEIDPRFAEAKAIVDQHMADQVASLYRFDVHEIKKAGVRGSLGDRPWLSRKENAKQFYEGLVDYLEEGFRYDSLQAPLNDIGKLLADPNMQSKMPNTVKFIQKHVDKITGQNLNVFGAAGNALIDKAFSMVGTGSKAPNAVVNAATSVSTTSMMGMFNLGFAGMQLSQIVTGGLPEAAAIRNTLGLSHESMVGSFTTAGMYHLSRMSLGAMDGVPAHLQEAFKWAHEKGMFDYSEAELLHNLNKSNARVKTEAFVNSTIVVPEKLTRPPVFMSFVDMFHKAGYVGEDGMLRAQAATDYAMTHYHPDERPGIYSALGQMGKMMGALSTYKHNFVEQGVSRVINGKQNKEALLVATALGASLYGVSGLPGYQEMNSAVEATTGKSIRELLLDNPTDPNWGMDGIASALSGVDIQSRVSMSSAIPDNVLQAAPHISNSWNILSSAAEYALNQDTASLNNLMLKGTPRSVQLQWETKQMTDENGVVRDAKGNRKVEQARTPEETSRRAMLGLRPLRERLQDETLWTAKQRELADKKKLKDVATRANMAIVNGDDVRPFLKQYQELGGDPTTILNGAQKALEEAQKTPKTRAQGDPSVGTPKAIKRYNNYDY